MKLYRELIARLQKRPGRPGIELGRAENNLATVYLGVRKAQEALTHIDRAIAVEEALLGAHHPQVLTLRRNRLAALGMLGHMEDVITASRALVTDTEAALGPDHLDTANALLMYGFAVGDTPAHRSLAITPLSRAVAILTAKVPGTEPTFMAQGGLCGALLSLDRFVEAGPPCQGALAFAEKQPGPEGRFLYGALTDQARLALGLGEPAKARAALERAFALYPIAKWHPAEASVAQLQMARVIIALHGDRQKARALAVQAEATGGDDEQLGNVRAWLKAFDAGARTP